METEDVLKIGKCCISEKPLSDCEHINLVQLDFKPKWKYPIANNFLDKGCPDHACAIVHDDMIDEKGKIAGEIKFAIEVNKNNIIYHPIESLEKINIENIS